MNGLRRRLAGGTLTRPTQGLLMAFLGAVLVRLALSDAYLRYVTPWMKWPLLVSGVVLVLLAVGLVLAPHDPGDDHGDGDGHGDGGDGHGHGPVPVVTWLLVLPGLVTFVISPPQLGSYLAERRSDETPVVATPASFSDLSGSPDEVVPVEVTEFIWRAQEGGQTLEDRPVELSGFVSYDQDGGWYVTRMAIGCCAADATSYRVEVEGADRPERDQWVDVTGTYRSGTGGAGTGAPVISATAVEETAAPTQTYE